MFIIKTFRNMKEYFAVCTINSIIIPILYITICSCEIKENPLMVFPLRLWQ